MGSTAIDYDSLAKKHGAIDYDALARQHGAEDGSTQQSDPSFWTQPKEYLHNRAQQMAQSSQDEINKAQGPESQGRSVLNRLGHQFLSYVPGTAEVADKALAGLLDWKNAAATAAGALNPAIPAAYFATQGVSDLTGVGQKGPGLVSQTIQNPTPENIQNALLTGASVVGSSAGGMSPKVEGTFNVPGRIASALPDRAASWYKSALKPSTSLSIPESRSMIQTALQNELPVTPAGVEKLWGLVTDLNNKISEKITEGNNAGVEISTKKVASRVDDIAPTFRNQVNPESDLANINASKQEFLDQHTQTQPYTNIRLSDETGGYVPSGSGEVKAIQDIPALQAQQIKQGTYRKLSDDYGDLSTAAKESQKALARGIREELGNAFPQINFLNASESRLLALEPELERAVQRVTNHQKFGIGTPLAAAGMKAATGSNGVAFVSGLMKAVVDNPSVKSKLAINLYRASRGTITSRQAAARVQAYVNALAATANSANSEDNQ